MAPMLMNTFAILYALPDSILGQTGLRPLFAGMSDVYSDDEPGVTYYVLVNGARILAGTDLIQIGVP